MATIEINSDSFQATDAGAKFIPLGQKLETEQERQLFRDKISGFGPKHPKIWGTLGKATQDREVGWSGRLSFSRQGNERSKGVTLEEIKDIYRINPAVNSDETRVIERYINLDDITFPEIEPEGPPGTDQVHLPGTPSDSPPDGRYPFSPRDIPNLRLTLFLNPNEGAMVFYHHYTGSWQREAYSDLEYILPEPTEGHSAQRDRLTYLFPIIPNRKIEEGPDGQFYFGEKHDSSFVVKILIFKRLDEETDSYQIVQNGIDRIRKEQRYKILRYDPETNAFVKNEPHTHGLQSDKRTLMLIHGTFSSTEGSFGGLLGTRHSKTSWLKAQSGRYDQIIGFDHSTIMHNAEDNLERFRDMMHGVHFRNNPIDIITFSRGGLVGKQLVCGTGNDQYPVRKAALVSCANGVGYFTAARYLGIFLRYLKTSAGIASGGMGAIISLFAQHSGKFFLSRPGAQQMTIGHSSLESILDARPAPHNKNMRFIAISGRWTRNVGRDSKLFSRWAQYGINVLTTPVLGTPNDFVVNTTRQQILPPGYENISKTLACTHTSFFTGARSAERVRRELEIWLG